MSSSLSRVKEVVDKVRHIQKAASEKGKNASKYITDRCNTIAKDEHERLNIEVDKDTGELLTDPVCSYRYYSQLMEDYRNGVKALGYKHHSIEFHTKAFIRKYKSKVTGLAEQLDSSLPIQKLRDNLILLRSGSITGSDFRKDLLNLKIEHHSYYMFEPKGVIKDWIRGDDKKSLSKKLHSQILVNPNYVKTLASDLLTKDEPTDSDLCIGLALATGRRLTEIMKTAKFTKVDDKTLLFSGQLKTKNRHLFEEIKPYQVPCMINPDLVLKALKTLRKATGKDPIRFKNVVGEEVNCTVSGGDTKDYYHNRGVQKKYESTMNRNIRSILRNGHFSLKDCRALYTEVTYEDHSKEGEARSAYRHRVLGHSLIETQLHYEAFQIDESVESVKLCEPEVDDAIADQQAALVEYLAKADDPVKAYARAPKIAIMHEWLKAEVSNGLLLEKITPSYIRRCCLFDGKQLNLNTIKKYVSDFIKLDQYEPPKEKPKKPTTKKEKAIQQLKDQIEEAEDRANDINIEREELDDELESIKTRKAEILEEDEVLELEKNDLDEELEDLNSQLEKLESEPDEKTEPADRQRSEEDSQVVDSIDEIWPDPATIVVEAVKDGKKWHVWAEVNGEVFEQWTSGRKLSAIKELRKYYKSSIMSE